MNLAARELPLRRQIIERLLADEGVRQRCEQYVGLLLQSRQRGAPESANHDYALRPEQIVPRPIDHRWEKSPALEAIIRLTGRPTLLVAHDTFNPEDGGAEWKGCLAAAAARLNAVIPSVGRVELRHYPGTEWLGTGFVVAANVIATNRHVAENFAHHAGGQYVFKSLASGTKLGSALDFKREAGFPVNPGSVFQVTKVLHLAGPKGPDMALLEVDWRGGPARPALTLGAPPAVDQTVAAIGHPGWTAALGAQPEVGRIFQGGFGVKRVAPGKIIEVNLEGQTVCSHDCSTLAGNSGSALVDLATGRVVGLHFSGRNRWANYAVQAPVLRGLLEGLGHHPA